MAIEALEDRALLTSMLYIDYGDRFPMGGLAGTIGTLKTATSGVVGDPAVAGPNLDSATNGDWAAANMANADTFNMDSFVNRYTIDGGNYTGGLVQLRQDILSFVTRFYSPFDISVVDLTATPINVNGRMVQAAASLAEISSTLGANEAGVAKNNDSYVMLGLMTVHRPAGNGGDFNPGTIFGGYASVIDMPNSNNNDNSAVGFLVPGSLGGSPNFGFLGNLIAHEAGHDFGLQHSLTQAPGGSVSPLIPTSEIMSYLGNNGFNFFSRYPMVRGNNNTMNNEDLQAVSPPAPAANVTPYDQWVGTASIGANAAFHYITGTGANDIITITKTGANQATVGVSAFSDNTYATALAVPGSGGASTTYTYNLTLDRPFIIDGGDRNDRIVLDGDLGNTITVRGMNGTDELMVMGKNAPSGTYTPGSNSANGLDGLSDLRGSIVIGPTTISFQEFDPGSLVTIQDVADLTFRTPLAADNLAVTSPAALRNRIDGASGGVSLVPMTFFNVGTARIDTGANDGGGGNDSVLVNSALVASGLQNFIVDTGTGNDSLSLFSANLSLPVGGGAFIYNAGANSTLAGDRIVTQADVNWTLTSTSLASSGGGVVTLVGVESANLAGGPSANQFDVSGWTGLGSLTGHELSDTVIAVKNASFTLSDSALTSTDGLDMDLDTVEVAQLSGGAGANSFDVGGWTGTGSLSGLGANDTLAAEKNANFTLTSALVTASDGLSMTLASIELASLTGGPGNNAFDVQSWNGPSVLLAGLGGSDTYTLATGDLDTIAAAVAINDTAGPADAAVLNDAGHAKLVDYTIDGIGVSTEFTSGVPRTFLGLAYNGGALELVTLNGSTGANNFYATPDEVTELNINGNNPTFAGPGVDYLEVDFAGTKGRKLTYSGPPLGNGMWEFLGAGMPLDGARKNINFTSIEKLNYFEVLAAGADEGRTSQPTVKIFDAETGDFSLQFQAYETNYRGGVRVAVGDVNGDGIPEVITTPAGLHAPTVKVFNILTGIANDEFQGSIPGLSPGLQVAVGDVTGDGKADVVTGWETGLPIVHIFANNGDYNAPFDDYRAKAGGGFPATPALNAFVGVFTFSFGIGGLAIGNVLGHPGGVGDIVVASATSLVPTVRVFDYFNKGTHYLPAKQIFPVGLGFGGGPISLAVGNVDSASGRADIVMGVNMLGQGRVIVWHNDTNSLTNFVAFAGIGANAPVHVAIKHNPGGNEIFAAQGPGGRSHELRRFQPNGVLVDSILEDDPEFAGGIWLG